MLDQYDGYLRCKVNYNDGYFAECDIVDALSRNPAISIDDDFWLGPDRPKNDGGLATCTRISTPDNFAGSISERKPCRAMTGAYSDP
jgi:hypothetical protein